jgi:hypothetical protein
MPHPFYMALDSLTTGNPQRQDNPATPQTPQRYAAEEEGLRGQPGPQRVADYKGSTTPVNIKRQLPWGLRIGDALPQISPQAAQAFVNILQGIRLGEAQIPLAVGPKSLLGATATLPRVRMSKARSRRVIRRFALQPCWTPMRTLQSRGPWHARLTG